jgi:hypothetical protein
MCSGQAAPLVCAIRNGNLRAELPQHRCPPPQRGAPSWPPRGPGSGRAAEDLATWPRSGAAGTSAAADWSHSLRARRRLCTPTARTRRPARGAGTNFRGPPAGWAGGSGASATAQLTSPSWGGSSPHPRWGGSSSAAEMLRAALGARPLVAAGLTSPSWGASSPHPRWGGSSSAAEMLRAALGARPLVAAGAVQMPRAALGAGEAARLPRAALGA